MSDSKLTPTEQRYPATTMVYLLSVKDEIQIFRNNAIAYYRKFETLPATSRLRRIPDEISSGDTPTASFASEWVDEMASEFNGNQRPFAIDAGVMNEADHTHADGKALDILMNALHSQMSDPSLGSGSSTSDADLLKRKLVERLTKMEW